jgi:hypothetical protein
MGITKGTNMNMNEMTPTQIDTAWLQLHSKSNRLQDFISNKLQTMAYYAGRRLRDGRGKTIILHPTEQRDMTTNEIVNLFANGEKTPCETVSREQVVATYNELCAELKEVDAQIEIINDEHRARQWSRFFLVTSSNGHIHSSMHCHTCNKGRFFTSFALLPSLSGANLETAVAKMGAGLCSVCFPDAPSEYQEQKKISAAVATVLLETGDEAKFDEALAKANARAAKKLAKAGA